MEKSDDGEIRAIERARLEHDEPEAMRRWLAKLDPEIPVALEATFGWPWVADLLESLGHPVHLGHPPGMKALAPTAPKSDRCDADRAGRFELQGTLPRSYLAPPPVRQIRERTRYRMALVILRTGVKCRIQAILHRLGILHSFSDLFGAAGRAFLAKLELPASAKAALSGYLALLDTLNRLIAEVECWMAENLKADEAVRLLETLPGVGLILAHVIRAEIGEIERFASPGRLARYSGLAPISHDTAGKEGPRHCSRACNHMLRWAFVEAVHGVQRTTGAHAQELRRLYARLSGKGRKGAKSIAKVAVAHELAKLAYVILSKRVPYTDTPPPRPGSRTEPEPKQEQPKQEQPKQEQGKQQRVKQQPKQPSAKPHEPSQASTARTTLRPDQSRHPMVRRRPKASGQTRV